jgi:hypothetical protein
MSAHSHDQLSIIERIERALVLLAYFIELDGDVYLPMYEKFEAELEEYKQALATRDRARRRLAAYSEVGSARSPLERAHVPAGLLSVAKASGGHAS